VAQLLEREGGVYVVPAASRGSAIDLGRFPLGNIARIDIVQGPSSALHGSDAQGGVVNLITRRMAVPPAPASCGSTTVSKSPGPAAPRRPPMPRCTTPMSPMRWPFRLIHRTWRHRIRPASPSTGDFGWYDYTGLLNEGDGIHHIDPRDAVHVVRGRDGDAWKLRLLDDYNDAGNGGHPTIEYAAVARP